MVRSIMEYCSFVVDGGPAWAITQYQTLQNDALRISERITDPRGVDIDALHARNKIPKLLPARERELMSYLHKLAQDPDNVVIPGRELRGNSKVKLKIPRSRKAIFDRSPIYRGYPLWDELVPEVQKMSHDDFIRRLKP